MAETRDVFQKTKKAYSAKANGYSPRLQDVVKEAYKAEDIAAFLCF